MPLSHGRNPVSRAVYVLFAHVTFMESPLSAPLHGKPGIPLPAVAYVALVVPDAFNCNVIAKLYR